MTTESQEIKRLVSERYANDARVVIGLTPVEATSAEADACCAPSGQERAMTLYQDAQLAGLPAESIAISLGCGNPTALAGSRRANACSTSGRAAASTASSRRSRWASPVMSSGST